MIQSIMNSLFFKRNDELSLKIYFVKSGNIIKHLSSKKRYQINFFIVVTKN